MLLRSREALRYFQFPAFCEIDGLRHAIFTRIGGRSVGPFSGFNLARSVGDAHPLVASNRAALREFFAPGTMWFTQQTHGTRVFVVDGGPPTGGPWAVASERPSRSDDTAPDLKIPSASPPADGEGSTTASAMASPPADAIVCDRPGQFAVIQVADCQAVLLADTRRRVVANIHSGWRGSIANIIAKTIATLVERCNTDPSDLMAGIGPSLGPCCGEFRNYASELPPAVWPYGDAMDHFDFWALSRDQLKAAGVPADRIHESRICTRCNTGLFYSYRASHTTGRFGAVIGYED
ncbi:MAG: polyphenol oxidase family protein [Desulfosarcinaceae bacterium]|nr:polyphenol oxidase family protein [Desulfosarcinaceae bacterium]